MVPQTVFSVNNFQPNNTNWVHMLFLNLSQHLYYHLHETWRLQTELGQPSNAECPARMRFTGTLEAGNPGDWLRLMWTDSCNATGSKWRYQTPIRAQVTETTHNSCVYWQPQSWTEQQSNVQPWQYAQQLTVCSLVDMLYWRWNQLVSQFKHHDLLLYPTLISKAFYMHCT